MTGWRTCTECGGVCEERGKSICYQCDCERVARLHKAGLYRDKETSMTARNILALAILNTAVLLSSAGRLFLFFSLKLLAGAFKLTELAQRVRSK